MIARYLIPVLYHVCENEDKTALHLVELFRLSLDIVDIFHTVGRRLGEGSVEIFDLITCVDIELSYHVDILFSYFLTVVSEGLSRISHGVNGIDYAVLGKPESDCHYEDKESGKERYLLCKE